MWKSNVQTTKIQESKFEILSRAYTWILANLVKYSEQAQGIQLK